MIILGTGWGEGPLAVEQAMQIVEAVWLPCALIVVFFTGYIVGGIVQRG
jgi:hypothetical protein